MHVQEIQTVGPGSMLGWSWLIPPYRWSFDARAVAPTSVIVVDGERLREACESDLKLGYELMKRFANNEFDMFGLGRTILCDPEYITKLRDGRFDEMMQTIDLQDVAGKEITFTKGKFAPQKKAETKPAEAAE